MKCNPNESLKTFIGMEHYLTEAELREIASCCLLGLDTLQDKGILHGVRIYERIECIGCETRESVLFRVGCGETGLLWLDNASRMLFAFGGSLRCIPFPFPRDIQGEVHCKERSVVVWYYVD